MSAVSIAAEVEGVRGQPVSDIVSDHTLHTVSNWSAWLSSQKEASCKDDAQKARKQFADDRQTKGHGLLEPCPVVWWDQDKLIWFRRCQASVAVTSVSVSCLQSSMVVGLSWSGAAWVLGSSLGSYSSLKEPWMPTCTVTYWSRAWSPTFENWGHRAVFQHDNNPKTHFLVNSMPKRVKAVLENNGGHTKYWHFEYNLYIFT